MNPCDCFKPPEFRVRTDTEVHGSCNCCRDNRCESQCGLCCFPFFRRRRSEQDERVHQVFEERIKESEELKDGAKTHKDSKDTSCTGIEGKKRPKKDKKHRKSKKGKTQI